MPLWKQYGSILMVTSKINCHGDCHFHCMDDELTNKLWNFTEIHKCWWQWTESNLTSFLLYWLPFFFLIIGANNTLKMYIFCQLFEMIYFNVFVYKNSTSIKMLATNWIVWQLWPKILAKTNNQKTKAKACKNNQLQSMQTT